MSRHPDPGTARFLEYLANSYSPGGSGAVQGPVRPPNMASRAPDWEESPPNMADNARRDDFGSMEQFNPGPQDPEYLPNLLRRWENVAANAWQRGLHDPYRGNRDENGMIRAENGELPAPRPGPQGFDPHLRMAEVVRDELGLEGWKGLLAEVGLGAVEPGLGEFQAFAKLLSQGAGSSIALLPGIPQKLQEMLGSIQHPSLVDRRGYPIAQHHGIGSARKDTGDTLEGPIRITNKEGHGHAGFFTTPNTATAKAYSGRYAPTTAYPDVSARGLYYDPNKFDHIANPLVVPERPIVGSRQDGAPSEYVTQLTREDVTKADGLMGDILAATATTTNPTEGTRVLENIQTSLRAGDFEEADELVLSLTEWAKKYMPPSADLWWLHQGGRPNNPLRSLVDPEMGMSGQLGYSDFARRLGFDASLGPWKTDWRAPAPRGHSMTGLFEQQVNLQGLPDEIATFRPEENTIYPVTSENIAHFLVRRGLDPEEVAQAVSDPRKAEFGVALRDATPTPPNLARLGLTDRYDGRPLTSEEIARTGIAELRRRPDASPSELDSLMRTYQNHGWGQFVKEAESIFPQMSAPRSHTQVSRLDPEVLNELLAWLYERDAAKAAH